MPWLQTLAAIGTSATASGGGGKAPGGANLGGANFGASSRSGDITVPLDLSFDKDFNPHRDDDGFSVTDAAVLLAAGGVLLVGLKIAKG